MAGIRASVRSIRRLTAGHRQLYSAGFATSAFRPSAISPCGGIGRRARLKIEFRKECWFDSGQGHQSIYTYRSFYHCDRPERWIAIIDSDVASSIAKLGERGSLVEGDMVGLGVLDLILRSVRARMMDVTHVIEVAGVYADDRAADATSLGILAHAIMDLEALRHGRPLRCAEELQRRQFLR